MSESKTATVKFVEDEDIYIDCKPVSTYGGEVVINEDVILKGSKPLLVHEKKKKEINNSL